MAIGTGEPTIGADGGRQPRTSIRNRSRCAAPAPGHRRLLLQRLFRCPGNVEIALGTFRVNAWFNLLAIATGALGLLLAGSAPRPYALFVGVLYIVLGVWGFAIDRPDAILGFLPASGWDDAMRVAIGLLGLAAAAGTPKRSRRRPYRRERRPPATDLRPPRSRRPRRRGSTRQGAGGDTARPDRDHRSHPVARVAKRAQLAVGELLGPVGELLRGCRGDRGKRVLEAPESRSGGSIGRSASLSRVSTSQVLPVRRSLASLIAHLLLPAA